MSWENVLREVKAGKISPVYFLYGDDEYPIQEIVKALKEAVAAGPMAQFNLDELSGQSLSWENIIERSRTLPMMSPRRLVIGWDVDRLLKKADDDAEAMAAYVGAPLKETVLVLTAKGLDKRTKLGKALDKGKEVTVVVAGHPRPGDVPNYVIRFAAAWNKNIDTKAAHALADLIGTETMWIKNEVEKLCVYVGDRKQITVEDVQAVMADINARQVWDLTEALAQKNFAECMKLLEPILRESEPPMVFGALANEIRKIAKVRRMMDAKYPRDAIAREFPPNQQWAIEKTIGHAKKFTVAELNGIYRKLEATDLRLKRSGASRILLESLIADICLS